MSADQNSFGKILHANEETEYVLGYTRKELLDKNINMIQPHIIKVNHNRILQGFLDSGKNKVIDVTLDLLPVNKQGYAELVHIVVKINSQINGRFLLLGMLQKAK